MSENNEAINKISLKVAPIKVVKNGNILKKMLAELTFKVLKEWRKY